MFIGVETDERGKALNEVAFKSIGTLASAVLREAELRSRAPSTAANGSGEPSGVAQLPDAPVMDDMSEFGGGPTKGGERQPALPVEGRPGKPNGKGRGTVKATASVRGSVEQPGGTAVRSYGQRMKPALRVVSSRCEPARNAANRDTPPRRVGSHLVLVVDHAAFRSNTGTSMRSKNS
jgi:hypothetical protein